MFFADSVCKNGQVITVNPNDDVVTAVAVYDEKIIYVGDDQGVETFIGENTKVIDLKGKTLMPGIVEAHAHLGCFATDMEWLDLSPKNVKSIKDIQAKVKAYADTVPEGSIIRGYHYIPEYLEEKRHPNKWDLDEVAPDHIVILFHTSYHMSACNSKALEVAGVTNNVKDPEGGKYEREKGELTGVVVENAHWDVNNAFKVTSDHMKKWLLKAQDFMIEKGVTSLHDAGDSEMMIEAMIDLNNEKKLKLRNYAMLFSIYGNDTFIKKYIDIGLHTGLGDNRYKIGPFKLMLDGSSMGGTCALREPYSHDPDREGILTMSQKTVNDLVLRAHKNHYQVTCHSIGDKAVEMMLDAYENALSIMPRENHRHRIEHCAIVDEALIERIKKLGVIPIPQPDFLRSSGDTYRKFYGDRVDMMFPLKAFLDAGIPCALSTDGPVAGEEPMLVLYSACKRVTSSGQEMNRKQEVSLMEAIRMYTYNGAYAAFEEDIKGSLEVGKLADMVILSKPILDIPIDALPDVQVEKTIIGGEIVYSKEAQEVKNEQ